MQKVEITLADCLACSGCVTSAESVLITQQSQEELLRVLEQNNRLLEAGRYAESKLIVVSVSVQPVLSLGARYGLAPEEAASRLAGYLKKLGVELVLDMTVAEDLALLESQREFVRRYRGAHLAAGDSPPLPLLSSSCPGWICYCEKTHGNLLPHVSRVKSPQQIMGALVKDVLSGAARGRDIYHVTVMPCYDKKLEAARQDFVSELTSTRDVDCVITASTYPYSIRTNTHWMRSHLTFRNVP